MERRTRGTPHLSRLGELELFDRPAPSASELDIHYGPA